MLTTSPGMIGKISRGARKIRIAWHSEGPLTAALTVVLLLRRALTLPKNYLAEVLIDVRLGVRTRGIVRNEATVQQLAAEKDSEYYEPVNGRWWRLVQSRLNADPGRTTFVDLGAGRGRVILLAARMGFQTVIGVELDPGLARDATENVRRWSDQERRRQRGPYDVRLIEGDAATFSPPPGPLVVAMFNPFGEATLRRVLTTLHSTSREPEHSLQVAYFNPVHSHVFDEYPQFVLQDSGKDWAMYQLRRITAPAGGQEALPE